MRFGRGGGPYNFTTRVRHALVRAREEAARHEQGMVSPEHVLLGLLADENSPAMAMLKVMGIRPALVRERLSSRLPPPGSTRPRRGQEYTGPGKRVLERAMEAARQLAHEYVGTEHILLGLIAGDDPVAAATLLELGASPAAAQAALQALLEPRAASFRITLDDASERSIFEQIVAQIQEAVATGRLSPGERLATVRQLADELDIAPGTVARAYAELERLGVVRTEGARGTRVAERPPGAAAPVDPASLVGLLRPVAVAAFHLGATAEQLRAALEESMRGILQPPA